MNDEPRYAGYRLIEFSSEARAYLRDVADRLIPIRDRILDGWLSRQFSTWHPPGFDRDSLGELFSDVLDSILDCMRTGELEACVDNLEQAGTNLAERRFPFGALIISVHYLEETYLPYLIRSAHPDSGKWLITIDEFLHVALAAIANSYFESYRGELLEQAEVGRIVQEGLLGHVPRRTVDLEIGHVYISAEEQAKLGGDFLDSFVTGAGEVSFIIGDLSGHGVEAAAESVMLRSLFRGFMREEPSLSSAMERLNHVVCTDLGVGHFATALAMQYDSSGRLKIVNAGHPFPVLCNDECSLMELHDGALAIDEQSTYTIRETHLDPGDILVAYTDGLIEARSKGEMFGEDGLIRTVSAMRNASPRAIVDQLVDNARRFAGGKLTDDVAVLVLKRRVPGQR